MTQPRRIIHWLPLDHPSLAPLRRASVILAGTDERWGPTVWGEGITDSTLLFFVVTGRVTSIGDGLTVVAGAGECLIVPAGCAKRISIKKGRIQAAWLHLSNSAQWNHLVQPVRTMAALEHPNLLATLMQSLRQETLSKHASTDLGNSLAESLAQWLIRNFGVSETVDTREMRRRLSALWESVSLHLAYPWTVSELAAKLHVSVGHFHRVVREHHHDHPMAIVTRMRLQRAAGLLRSTYQKLETIAEETGYKSAFALSNAFLREMGVRPGQYRRKILE